MRCCTFAMLSLLPTALVVADDNWPQFRGPQASGIGSGRPPVRWDVMTGENVEWKTSIPGLGHSSPIVWGERVFLTTAISEQTEEPSLETGWLGGTGASADDKGDWKWTVLCLELDTGKVHWQEVVAAGKPITKRHIKASHANCTPATNGRFVVAFFGSQGLYCLDLDGNLVWKKNLGRLDAGPYNAPQMEWGFASSPIIHEDNVIVQCDCLNTGFVAILDLETGDEVRRIRRHDVATWSTPLVISTDSGAQIVCNGYRSMAGYDLETGGQLWSMKGGGDIPVPTPLFAQGLILLTNGHGRTPTYAVSPSARGELTPERLTRTGLVWWQPRDGSYMPTPLALDGLLYTCNDNGRLVVRRAATGELVYQQRLPVGTGTFSASAASAGGHLYFTSEPGDVHVVKAGTTFELVAKNKLNEVSMATPAIANDRLLIRTARNLFCIGPDVSRNQTEGAAADER